VKNGEMTGVTGEMTGEKPGIPGKRAVRQPGRRSKSARKPTIRAIGNVDRKSVMPRTTHATLPGTYGETNHKNWTTERES
jgi:hypothetical protein